jgi:leishmanolysin
MEGDGDTGTVKSHFERRHFGMEYMTSGLIYQMQVSEFTLALLEGSGWYYADFSMADTYTFGQGQGCDFLFGGCIAYSHDEWCSGTTRGCTSVGRGGGSCATDSRANYCRYQHPNINYDCENDGAINYARLPNVEVIGRYKGGKCFEGTLTTGTSATSTTFCLKPTCSGSGTSTNLTINVGSTQITCTKKGSVTVPGYNGVINCPDPVEFCATTGAPKTNCPRGCMGRGQCVNGQCVCNGDQQFLGTDCGLRWGYGV